MGEGREEVVRIREWDDRGEGKRQLGCKINKKQYKESVLETTFLKSKIP